MISAPAHVIDFEAALALVAELAGGLAAPVATERVPLLQARGRVLAAAIRADRDQPPFDRSTRDGFAVRAAEWRVQADLTVVGTLKAGDRWERGPLGQGETVEIMTGAALPPGADAVAMLEHAHRDGDRVKALAGHAGGRSLMSGDNVVAHGSEASAGDMVLAAGTQIGPAEIALAAACGGVELTVFERPRVAIIATGDELVELDRTPEGAQIRNSNSYALAAMVEAAGGEAVRLPITPDTREAIAASLEQARPCDLIVFSGGVSMGQYDLVEEGLLAAEAEFFFTGVKMQPGKPVVMGRLPGGGFFFGLPGNPVSTQVTFHCLVEPFLRTMTGTGIAGPRWALARLVCASDRMPERKADLTRVLPARRNGVEVRLVDWQGSGDLAANARANCYAELPAGEGPMEAGAVIRVLLR